MNADERRYAPIGDLPPRRSSLSFSLQKLFFLTTCVAVMSAGYSLAREAAPFLGALGVLGLFLTIWFGVKEQLKLTVVFLTSTCVLGMLASDSTRDRNAGKYWCQNNLREIGIALQTYQQIHGSFPQAYVADSNGKPLYSWRVLILPYLDRSDINAAFQKDQAWDAPANAKCSQCRLSVYLCAADNRMSPLTDYLAVVGPNTAWPGTTGRKLSEIKDPSKTILVVEVDNSGIRWAEPCDLQIDQMAAGINSHSGQGISSVHPRGANVLFADGHVEFLSENSDPKAVAAMLDINLADEVGPRKTHRKAPWKDDED
jgi:prepilin-type processing-associated H-X9-DG protein